MTYNFTFEKVGRQELDASSYLAVFKQFFGLEWLISYQPLRSFLWLGSWLGLAGRRLVPEMLDPSPTPLFVRLSAEKGLRKAPFSFYVYGGNVSATSKISQFKKNMRKITEVKAGLGG